MKQETIKATIGHTAALDQLSSDCMLEYIKLNYGQEILEGFTDDELIAHLGGIDQLLENNTEAAIEFVNNINGPDEE